MKLVLELTFIYHTSSFPPSIRGVFSIDNEIIQDNDPISPWTSNIDRLFTQGLIVNFTFE